MTDSPDCSIELANKIIFDTEDQARPRWKIGCSVERSLVFCLIHLFVLIGSTVLCILYLFVFNNDSDNKPHIWSVLAFCLGCIIATPK